MPRTFEISGKPPEKDSKKILVQNEKKTNIRLEANNAKYLPQNCTEILDFRTTAGF